MKLEKEFIDCVNETSLCNKDIKLFAEKLIYKLPDQAIVRLASILVIDTKSSAYVVKLRNTRLKEDGTVDIEKVHKIIKESDFIEISNTNYSNINKNESITSRTMHLITPGANVIFKMNIDVDNLIQ